MADPEREQDVSAADAAALATPEADQPASTSAEPAAAVGEPFDFRRVTRVSRDRLRVLEVRYGNAADSLAGWLSTRMRMQVELEVLRVEALPLDEALAGLAAPRASFAFRIGGTAGRSALVDLDAALALVLVDRLLGGPGEPLAEARALTPLERLVIKPAVEEVARLLAEVWRDEVALELTLDRFESEPELLRICGREERVVVAELGLREREAGRILLVLPYAAVESFFAQPTHRRILSGPATEQDRVADRRAAEEALARSSLVLTARLPTFGIPLRRLSALAPGDIIETGLLSSSPLLVMIGSRHCYQARPGRVGGRLALQITERIVAEPANDPDANSTGRSS